MRTLKKLTSLMTISLMTLGCISCVSKTKPIDIKVLILPKFEVDELTGDNPGEGQFYYEEYCLNGKEYDIDQGSSTGKLYVKDGIGFYILGEGKVNAALSTYTLLNDSRFDFSSALILSTGCCGSSIEYGVPGDVYVISATVDLDIGHTVDSTEIEKEDITTTWYHDSSYDNSAYRILNENLINSVYELTKDVKLETTDTTIEYMSNAFNNAAWAVRNPSVLKGTAVTSDNYWKGEIGHNNAVLAVETYQCPDPYAATEMEDNAVAVTLDRLHLLNHLVVLRDSVNVDVFVSEVTPDSLWDPAYKSEKELEYGVEDSDIFNTAMENNFKVGKVVIDAFLNGKISF